MKNKIHDWFCKNKIYVYTFLISLITISIIFKIENITPLGDMSLLCTDFFHQYGPMMGELHDRVLGGKSLIYSFTMGLGLPFFRNFFNYLSSPFNILLFLFKKENLVTIFSLIIGLKVVCSSVTMVYFLSKKFKTKKYTLIPLGIMYAFSAWFIAYFWNIMWLDGMVFLPLVTFGIEKIVDERKWKMYVTCLFIMMFSNFFIAFMICIFSVMYFIMYSSIKYFEDKRKMKEKLSYYKKMVLTFIASSLLAGALGAFFLLPMAKSITSISATGDEVPTEQYYKFEPVDYLFSHFSGVDSTVFSSDNLNNPNVSCGVISIVLISLFLLNPKISLKVRIGYFTLLGFFILSFFVPQLDFLLHAFHVPNDLPYRYSFLYSFIFIIMCGYLVVNMEKVKPYSLYSIYFLLMAVLLLVKTDSWKGLTNEMILYNIGLLTAFFILFIVCYFKKSYGRIFTVLFTILVCVDASVSTCSNWDLTIEKDYFYDGYDQKIKELDYINKNDNEKFYRIETLNYMTLNDGSWYGYNGISSFSSMNHENMAILQHNLGVPGNEINSFYYTQSTPIYDLMLDVKYTLGVQNDDLRYSDYQYFDDETVSVFHYAVGPIFGVKESVTEWNFSNPNPLEVQNDFMKKAYGIEDVLSPVDISDSEVLIEEYDRLIVKYTIKNPKDNMYFYSNSSDVEAFVMGDCLYYNDEIYLNGDLEFEGLPYSSTSDYASDGERYIVNISSTDELIELYVVYRDYYSQGFELYTINHDSFFEAYEYFNNYKFEIEDFHEDLIEGKIKLDEGMMVYTSIPYDEGWEVFVDGKKVKAISLGNALLAFDCPMGEHEVKLKYRVPLMMEGAIISISSFIGMIILEIYKKKKR